MFKKRIFVIIFTIVMIICFNACTGSGGKIINSAVELKEYLDKQPANSPDNPIKISMNVNNLMLKDISEAITSAGKYVDLNFSQSTGLTEIGKEAFANCNTLTSITLPNGVIKIDIFAFEHCNNLKNITIPNSVTEIGSWAFSGCTNLMNIIIPNSITKIESWVFENCKNLTDITISNNIIEIDEGAFLGCTNLTSVIFEGNTLIYKYKPYDNEGTFDGDLYDKYKSGGSGTYIREIDGNVWIKQ